MNLTGTNWKIKDTPSLSAIGSKDVNFTSNKTSFNSMTIAVDGITYGSTLAYGEAYIYSQTGAVLTITAAPYSQSGGDLTI